MVGQLSSEKVWQQSYDHRLGVKCEEDPRTDQRVVSESIRVKLHIKRRRPSVEMFPTAMDETERMVALKKVYAEMILNNSKEAAARVMAAERKAHKFEQDLLSVKEEALRMLLRMKQMIDSKDREAEIISSNEKRRITELEAQLDEAEGLIIDLRAKLSEVQDQLDDVKGKYMHSLKQTENVIMPTQNRIYENEQNYFASLKSFSGRESTTVTSEVLACTSEHSLLDHECFASAKETAAPNTEFDHHPMHKPLFASVISKSREHELYRNRCTQRICPFEMGLVDVKLHSADEIISLLENKSTIRRKEQNEVINFMPIPGTDKFSALDISTKQTAFLKGNPADDQPVKLHKMRRRTHYGRTRTTSCRYRSGQVVKPRRRSFAISHCNSHSHISSEVHRPGCVSTRTRNINKVDYTRGLEEKGHLAKHQMVPVIRRSVRKRKIKNWDGFATSCRLNDSHSCRYDEPFQTDKTVKCDKEACEDQLEVKDGSELEEATCIREASTNYMTCMNAGGGSTFLGDFTENDTRMLDKSMPEKLDGLGLELELEKVSGVPSDLKETSEMTSKAPSQPDSEKPLKYTFVRKRKTALTNPAEGDFFQQSSKKKRSGEETDIVLPPASSNCVCESFRDGRGLVQIARQLISLSGKKWV